MNAPAIVTTRYPRHLAATGLVCGLACACVDSLWFGVAAIAAAAFLLCCGAPLAPVAASLALAVAGTTAGQARLASIDADPLSHARSIDLSLRGWALEHPRPGRFGFSMRVRAVVGEVTQKVEFRWSGSPARIDIGDEVSAQGTLHEIEPASSRTAASRARARMLIREGVRRMFRAKQLAPTGAKRGGLVGWLDSVRVRAERAMQFGVSGQPAALLRGMVLGGSTGLSEQVAADFKASGLAHVIAVSGSNILLLIVLVAAIARTLGAGRTTRVLMPAVLIAIYVPLCGGQASVVRAGAMGLAGLAALTASRPADRVYALLLGAIAVLAWNPRATADVGAQLSFAAVLGIAAFARPFAERLTRCPRWMAEALATTAGATLATAPLMALHFGQVSVVSLVANVVAAPLIAPIVWLGSLAAAIGQVSVPLAALLNAPNQFLLATLLSIAGVAASVPGAQVGATGFGVVELLLAAVSLVAMAWMLRRRSTAPAAERARAQRGVVVILVFTIVPVAGVIGAGTPSDPPKRPAIVFLDIGQGDATVLLGARGCNALIDGGPSGAGLVPKLRKLGIDRLDLIVATHPQEDHHGGLVELAKGRRIRANAFLDGGGLTGDASFAELRRLLRARGVESVDGVEGASWRCGDLAVNVLGPPPLRPGAPPPEDPNTRAIVTEVRVGPLTMLASGDAESPQLGGLPLGRSTVLKVPHHGSDDPGLSAVLARVRPAIAVIEVGRGNRYGHPTQATLRALGGVVPRVLRTDRDGQVVVGGDGTVSTSPVGGR